jgi:signal transduction histidine kinase
VKIKTQFYLLVAGILLVPILVIMAQRLFSRINDDRIAVAVPVYEEIAPLLDSSIGDEEWERISSFLSLSRPDTTVTVFRGDFMVLFSTMDAFTSGQFATPANIIRLLTTETQAEKGRYGYSFEVPPWVGEHKIFLLQRFEHNLPRTPNARMIRIRILLLTTGLILLFVLSMLFFITRSITQSVMLLEKATRRIADGELNIKIDIKGSNEITSLTSSLNHMRLALKEEELRRNRFIMGITHDLKTPLALIKGYAEAIEDGMTSDPSTLRHSVSIITAKTDQLEGMINDLIDFVRIDSREWKPLRIPVNMSTFLTFFAKRIKDDAELLQKVIETRIDISPDCTIPMDEHLTVRALENLVNNAIRYTGEGGLIVFSSWQKEGDLIIEIRDNGLGIKPDDLPHVFEMFYRGTNSRREQGMGMGLSVVRGIVESQGWKAEAASVYGEGACFRITVPAQGGLPQ